MENRINIAKLLKDCPKGMELNCLLWDNVTFESVADGGIWIKRIDSKDGEHLLYVYNDGSFPIHNISPLRTKCVIFPKGKTTWEGFQIPIKNSEIEDNIVDIVKENDNRFRIVLNHQFDMEVDEGEYYAVRRPQLLSNIWHDIDEEPIYVNGVTPIIIDSNYGHISQEGHCYDQVQWKHHIESQRHREFKWAYENDLMSL